MKLCQRFEVIHVLGGATEPRLRDLRRIWLNSGTDCSDRRHQRDGGRSFKHCSTGSPVSVDNACANAMPVQQRGILSFLYDAARVRRQCPEHVCAAERSVVLSDANDWTAGHGYLRHLGEYAV